MCLEQKSENVQSRNMTLLMPSNFKVTAAKFTVPIEQPSNKAAECHLSAKVTQ